MKRLLVCVLAAAMLLVTAACGGGKAVEVDMEALAAELLDSGAFTDILSQVPDTAAPVTYGLDAADVSGCVMYASTGATAEEIFIVHVSDSGAVSRAEEAARRRIANQQAAFENYAPAEIPKLQDAVVETAGDYVIVVISGDAAAARAVVDGYLS